MYNFIRFLPVLFFFTLFIACKQKDTIINGRVVDSKTGEPIEGATINYAPLAPSTPNVVQGTFNIKTDQEGKFQISLTPDIAGFSGFTIEKANYLPKFNLEHAFIRHEVNEIENFLHPKDATLRLIYNNSSSIEKQIFMQAQSKTLVETYGLLPFIITQPYPFACQPNKTDTLDYLMTSGEQIYLSWDFIYFEKAYKAQFKDSLTLIRGDTAKYIILF